MGPAAAADRNRVRGGRLHRWLVRVGAGIALLLTLALGAGWIWLDRSAPRHAGRFELDGLAAPVDVVRDGDGVPHIFATSATDAYFAQGFVHAQDRFAQMDGMRMVARGRLAEMVGRGGLASDRFMRGMGLAGRAEAARDALSPEGRAALEAYARGVNAFLAQSGTALPLELRLSGRIPEPWEPADSLLWGELMALYLSGNWRDELARLRLSAAGHDPRLLALLWPDWRGDGATSLATGAGAWDPVQVGAAIAALPDLPSPPLASNAWVFAGARTRSGKPLLANDPHLQLGAPSVWYLVRLVAPGFLRAGASAPGVPGIVLGHNGHVAWGMTTTGADSFDLVLERLVPGDPDSYATPDGPARFTRHAHAIAIRGEPDPARVEIRRTRNGVVLADLLGSPEAAPAGDALVLRALLDTGTNGTGDALLRMTAATDVPAMLAAAEGWRAPVQNLFVADRDGRIALAAIGAVPRRRLGDGTIPTPGWDPGHGWDGIAAGAALPRAVDPPHGFLMNANDRLAPDRPGPFLTADWDAPFRARRLREGLAGASVQDLDSAAAWQRDAISVFARDVLGDLAAWTPGDAAVRRIADALRAWNGDMRREAWQPLVFNAWMRALRADALDQLLGSGEPGAPIAMREVPALLLAIAGGDPWLCARIACGATLERSLSTALVALGARYGSVPEAWRWGDAHAAVFENPLWRSIPVVSRLFGFSVPVDGDNFTVNRATPRQGGAADFAAVHGGGLRAVYDLADLDSSRFMIAPGQSGHPWTRHWGDLAQHWADGQMRVLAGGRDALARTGTVLRLGPRAVAGRQERND
jgi:penicillin amidase